MNSDGFDLRFLSSSEIREASRLMANVYHADPSVAVFIPLKSEPERAHLLDRYFRELLWLSVNSGKVVAAFRDIALAGLAIYYPPQTYPQNILLSKRS